MTNTKTPPAGQREIPVAVPDGWKLVPVKITQQMIEGAMAAHYGVRRLRQAGGPGGVDMTVNCINYNGNQAMKRMWAGALAAAPTPPVQQPVQLRFPTMLRKMWSGGEVQAWLDEQGPLYTAPPAQQQNEPQNIPEIIPAPEQPVTATLKHSTKENGDCLSWCKACATEIKQRALLEANK